MTENFFEPRLEALLTTKIFSELTADEKKYVFLFLTEKEYVEYSLLMLNYKQALLTDYGKIQPAPKTLSTLTQAFKNQYAQPPVVRLKANYSLLAAATVLLLIGIAIVFITYKKKPSVEIAKTRNEHPVIYKALKIQPSGVKLDDNIAVKSVKGKLPGVTEKINDFLCLDIIPADSLDEMPCLNPLTTMIRVPGVDDTEEDESGS